MQRSFRWRCRKIGHHFVLLHGYRSDRGRGASHSVQPARNGMRFGSGLAFLPGVWTGGGLRPVGRSRVGHRAY